MTLFLSLAFIKSHDFRHLRVCPTKRQGGRCVAVLLAIRVRVSSVANGDATSQDLLLWRSIDELETIVRVPDTGVIVGVSAEVQWTALIGATGLVRVRLHDCVGLVVSIGNDTFSSNHFQVV